MSNLVFRAQSKTSNITIEVIQCDNVFSYFLRKDEEIRVVGGPINIKKINKHIENMLENARLYNEYFDIIINDIHIVF